MNEEEIKHLYTLREITESRLRLLEIQETRLGYNVQPEILMEIKDLKRKLLEINRGLDSGESTEEITLDDVIESMIASDKDMVRLIEKSILLNVKSMEIANMESQSIVLLVIICILSSGIASIFVEKMFYALLIGIIPAILYELYYYVFIRPKVKAFSDI